MKVIPAGVQTILASRKYFRAQLFTLTLIDGTVLYYTDFDMNIISGGHTFLCGLPGGPFFNPQNGSGNKVKAHWKIGVDVDTIQFDVAPGTGLIEGVPFLTAVRIGMFDAAQVQIDRAYMPSSAPGDASAGVVPIFTGYVGDVDISDSIATFTVNGATVLLTKSYPVDMYQPGCLNTLYDTNCTLSRSSFQATGAVTAGSTANAINDATLSGATGIYDLGIIKMTSGQNNNFLRGVQTYTHSPNILTLMSPLPFAPAIGDTFTVFRGCNKILTDGTRGCTSFANTANFRGMPFVPAPETAV